MGDFSDEAVGCSFITFGLNTVNKEKGPNLYFDVISVYIAKSHYISNVIVFFMHPFL